MLEPSHNNELPAIPGKRYFTIGEVSELCAVKPHVLRYWETEFGFLSPQKNEGNQRLDTPKDLEKVMLIRKLLYEDRFTIAGAKRKLREERKTAGAAMRNVRLNQLLSQIKGETEALTRLLDDAAEL